MIITKVHSKYITESVSLIEKPAMDSKNTKCNYGDCKKHVAHIIGDCVYCVKKFCVKHRLPESHNCHNIELCKRIANDRNSNLLMQSKCVGNKI